MNGESVGSHPEAPRNLQQEVDSVRRAYAGQLLPDELVDVFRDPTRAFATQVVRRGARVLPLPQGVPLARDLQIISQERRYDLVDYISRNRVAGLLVLRDGRIALEHFEFGNDARTHWLSMSIAKSISTTLVGAAIRDGYIESVEEPLTRYLPQFAGTAYEGVSIRHVLQMSSGVRWDDSHTDENSERRQMLELQFSQQHDAVLRYLQMRPRSAAPGTVWNYSTGETHIVGALVRAAVGRSLCDYLTERIWSRFGMESDASWWLEAPGGLEVAGSGFGATLRDYGRFGLFIMDGGVIDGMPVLPENWLGEATSPREIGGQRVDYGYMWWPVPCAQGSYAERAFSARGIFGQYLYVNPHRRLVIAVWSARSKPLGAEAILDNDFFNAVAAAS